MAGNCEEKTMGAFYRPVIGEVSSPIVMNDTTRAYELKQNHFNLLPSFHGLANEDSLAFISDYCQALRSFPLSGLTEDQLKVRCFEYCLKDRAKSWLMSLPADSLKSWADITKQFMLQYYPVKKTQEVRAKLMSFTQEHDEQFHEAYGRFKELLKQCPHHLFPPQLYWQLFYDGLAQPLQYMADNAAGGNIANVTATALEDIFETMAANSKQKSSRRGSASVSAVEPDHTLTKQVASLMREVQQLKLKKNDTPMQQIQELGPCGVCHDMGHDCDTCPNMREFSEEGGAEAYVMQGFHTQQQTYELPQQQFNSGWNRQSNSSWRNQNQGQGFGANNQFRRPTQYQPLAPPQQFGTPQQQFPVRPNRQQQYQAPHGQYQPTQQYPQPQRYQPPQPRPPAEEAFNSYMTTNDRRAESTEASLKRLEEAMGQIATTLSNLQQQHDKDKLPGQAHQAHAVSVIKEDVMALKWRSKTVSAIKARQSPIETPPPITMGPYQMPPKQDDPGSFILSIDLGSGVNVSSMLDLGAAVNLMPYDVFEKLGTRELKPTNMKIELADGSISFPRGIVEDVIVTVRGLRVSVDFVVLDVGKGIKSESGHLVLLGRPFMATTNTRIDVRSGTLSMAGLEGSVTFSVFNEKYVASTPLIQNCSYVRLLDTVDEHLIPQEFFANIGEENDIVQEFLTNLQDEEAVMQEFLIALQGDEEVDSPTYAQVRTKKKKKKARHRVGTKCGGPQVIHQLGDEEEKLQLGPVNDGWEKFPFHSPDMRRLLAEELWLMSVGSKLLDPAWHI